MRRHHKKQKRLSLGVNIDPCTLAGLTTILVFTVRYLNSLSVALLFQIFEGANHV